MYACCDQTMHAHDATSQKFHEIFLIWTFLCFENALFFLSMKYFSSDVDFFVSKMRVFCSSFVCCCHITNPIGEPFSPLWEKMVVTPKVILKDSILQFDEEKYSWQRKSVAGYWNSNWLQKKEEAVTTRCTVRLLLSQRSEGDGEASIHKGWLNHIFLQFSSLTRPLTTQAFEAIVL